MKRISLRKQRWQTLKIVNVTNTKICAFVCFLNPTLSPHFRKLSRREAFPVFVNPQEMNMFFRSPSTSLSVSPRLLLPSLSLTHAHHFSHHHRDRKFELSNLFSVPSYLLPGNFSRAKKKKERERALKSWMRGMPLFEKTVPDNW